jgi:hypothetical protein
MEMNQEPRPVSLDIRSDSKPTLDDFIAVVGGSAWDARIKEIGSKIGGGARTGRLAAQRYAAECAIEKARRGQQLVPAETALVALATRVPALYEVLRGAGRDRFSSTVAAALAGEATLIPLLHLLHTAGLQRSRGFDVAFTGLQEATAFDLLISRDGAEAEIACEPISAEEGHAVHRAVWTKLIDRVDPDLQTWLAAHPGRYILKMTLPNGLRSPGETELPALHRRIKEMLAGAARADFDEAAMLRLDPLLLAGAQSNDVPAPAGVLGKLRREFGPEAQLAMTTAGSSVFIMAARAADQNAVAAAIRQRLAAVAPVRLTGQKPGIIAMMIDDLDQPEWLAMRDQLVLEGEVRKFLTCPEAAPVVAVTCASRFELGKAIPVVAPEGDLRFRNPRHPAAKSPGLAPAVLSTV